jgi:hypothetical protein
MVEVELGLAKPLSCLKISAVWKVFEKERKIVALKAAGCGMLMRALFWSSERRLGNKTWKSSE